MFVSPHILLVNKDKSPFKTLEDFVDDAKKHPGELSFGSTGVGGSVHLSTEVLMLRTGIKMNQVPFAGAARAVTALLGGHVDCIITSPSTAGDHIKPGGGLRVLVSLATPLPGLPDVPTCQQKGYNVNRAFWASLAAPAGTPKPVLDILSDTFDKTANDPNVKAALTKLGTLPVFWNAAATEKKAKEDYDAAREVFEKLGML
jgi:tripartite-type tricarboxylate transporter receptor subunit TctC